MCPDGHPLAEHIRFRRGQGQPQEMLHRWRRDLVAPPQQRYSTTGTCELSGSTAISGPHHDATDAGSTDTPRPAPTKAIAVWTRVTRRSLGSKPASRPPGQVLVQAGGDQACLGHRDEIAQLAEIHGEMHGSGRKTELDIHLPGAPR